MHLRVGLQLIIGDFEVSVLREARQGVIETGNMRYDAWSARVLRGFEGNFSVCGGGFKSEWTIPLCYFLHVLGLGTLVLPIQIRL
jgi:hypothetical protein